MRSSKSVTVSQLFYATLATMSEQPTALEHSLIRAIAEAPNQSAKRFFKLDRVVSAAAKHEGCWSQCLEDCLVDELREWRDSDLDFYEQCARVIRAGTYIEGQGNYGGPDVDDEFPEDWAPAHPKFLECRLTPRGRAACGK